MLAIMTQLVVLRIKAIVRSILPSHRDESICRGRFTRFPGLISSLRIEDKAGVTFILPDRPMFLYNTTESMFDGFFIMSC